jgi:hypothetical protein
MQQRENGRSRLTPRNVAKLLGVLVLGGAVMAASCASVPKSGDGSSDGSTSSSSNDGGQSGTSSGTGILGW